MTVALRASTVSVFSLQEVASLHPECSEQPKPSANIPALSCTEVCKQEGPSAQMNQMPAVQCFPHSFPLPGARDPCVYPHCTYTVKKLWALVSTSKAALAAALEMEPDNFGTSGWYVPEGEITADGGAARTASRGDVICTDREKPELWLDHL